MQSGVKVEKRIKIIVFAQYVEKNSIGNHPILRK